MEKNQKPELDEFENKLSDLNKELEQKKRDLIIKLDTPAVNDTSIESDKKISEFIGDIFYKSMKNLFDTGAKLAKKLSSEFLAENRK